MVIITWNFWEIFPVVVILGIIGIVLIVLILKEGTRYWQWMPMHKLFYKITKKRRFKKGKMDYRRYDERADLYMCPTCRQYLGIDELVCTSCGQRMKKSFWV